MTTANRSTAIRHLSRRLSRGTPLRGLRTALVLVMAGGVGTALAAPVGNTGLEDPDRLRAVVQAHVLNSGAGPMDIDTPTLDRPLNLPHCAAQPEAFDPPGQASRNRRIVGVRCPGGWSVYIPVRLSMTVTMVALSRPVGPGEALSADDLRLTRKPVSSMPLGYIGSVEQALGSVTRQALPEGTVLRPTQLRAGQAVQRGQHVRLVVQRDGLRIESAGEVLADGAVGAWVKVRNPHSGRIVEGRVDDVGLVLIP
ncbi:MAG: flagellar basal body P-ring formation chaperone FlgA [Oceanococcaceae bacterium]